MAKKKATTVENQAGGLDLIVEKDSGNEVRISTGDEKNSLEFWEHMKELCEVAIFELKDK